MYPRCGTPGSCPIYIWTAVAQPFASLQSSTCWDFGHSLENITAALNKNAQTPMTMRAIDAEDCAAMQVLVDDLDDSTCLTKQPLCTPAVNYLIDNDSDEGVIVY